jgi:hypothetical protein
VNTVTRGLAGDHRWMTTCETRFAISGYGELNGHVRPAIADATNMAGMGAPGLVRSQPYFDGDSTLG